MYNMHQRVLYKIKLFACIERNVLTRNASDPSSVKPNLCLNPQLHPHQIFYVDSVDWVFEIFKTDTLWDTYKTFEGFISIYSIGL